MKVKNLCQAPDSLLDCILNKLHNFLLCVDFLLAFLEHLKANGMKFKLGTYNESMEAPTPICIYFSINISIFLTIILNEFVSLKMSCWLPRDILRLTKRSICIWLCFSITSVQLILHLKQVNIEGILKNIRGKNNMQTNREKC